MSITVPNPLIQAILQGNEAAPDDGLFTAENVSTLFRHVYDETMSKEQLSLLAFCIGHAYECELGVDQNLDIARFFYDLSKKGGYTEAESSYQRVEQMALIPSNLKEQKANNHTSTSLDSANANALSTSSSYVSALSGNASPPGDSPKKASVDSSSTSQHLSSKLSFFDILTRNSNPLNNLLDVYLRQKSNSENATIAMKEAIVALVPVQASFEKAKDLVSKRTAASLMFSEKAEVARKSYDDEKKNQQIKMEKEKQARLDQQIGIKKKMAKEARAISDKASIALALLTTQTASLNIKAEKYEISLQSFIASIPSSLKAVALQEPAVKPGQVHIQDHVQDHVPAHILVRPPFQNPNHIPIPAHGLVLPEKRFWVYKENLDAIFSYWRSKDGFPRLPARGLRNVGNTCFINASLQCLAASIHFTSTFYSSDTSLSGSFSFGRHGSTCKVPKGQFCVNRSVEDFIGREMFDSLARGSATPFALVNNIESINPLFTKKKQEDAHEFLISLLQRMMTGFLEAHGVKEGSPDRLDETTAIHSVFGGYLLSHVQCLSCNTKEYSG